MNGAGKFSLNLAALFLFADLLPLGNKSAKDAAVKDGITEPIAPPDLKRIYFVDGEGKEYGVNGEIKLNKGDFMSLSLKGRLESDKEVDLSSIAKTFLASIDGVSIDSEGKLTANQVGAS